MTDPGHPASQLERVLGVLGPALDIVAGRVTSAQTPLWCEARDWTSFLLGLNDAELEQAEETGLLSVPALVSRLPTSLAVLLGRSAEAQRVPRLAAELGQATAWRRVRERKRAQLAAMLSSVAPFAQNAERIVDFGAGRGHFSRLAADVFESDVLGLERSAERVEQATLEAPSRARFLRLDLAREDFQLTPSDLAFGLHACGELGDRMIQAAGRAGCDVVLVSCCAQKISTAKRAPLSRALPVELERETLGLSNLSPRERGVETSLRDTLRAREARHALGLLLRGRGIAVLPGEELSGLNRRAAHAAFPLLAARALALRDLPAPEPGELTQVLELARTEFSRVRRLSLPRNALARLLELAIVLDRALALSEAGLQVRIAEVFDAQVTPRNLGLFASHARERLPELAVSR